MSSGVDFGSGNLFAVNQSLCQNFLLLSCLNRQHLSLWTAMIKIFFMLNNNSEKKTVFFFLRG